MLHTLGAFFDGAKNAAAPNLVGKEGLLAATALLFSTRFLLMAVGSAFGGWASAVFGYEVAFIINAASFLASAYTVWLIPEEATRNEETGARMNSMRFRRKQTPPSEQPNFVAAVEPRESFLTELREGFKYAKSTHFALTILVMNVIWATGGGAIWRLVCDRCVYAHAVALLRCGIYIEGDRRRRIRGAGNDVSAQFARLYSRANVHHRTRSRADGISICKLRIERPDVLYDAADVDDHLGDIVGTCGVLFGEGGNQREKEKRKSMGVRPPPPAPGGGLFPAPRPPLPPPPPPSPPPTSRAALFFFPFSPPPTRPPHQPFPRFPPPPPPPRGKAPENSWGVAAGAQPFPKFACFAFQPLKNRKGAKKKKKKKKTKPASI
ncbi:MAG: MFS transporter [Chloracidobacterium sp.]|nr:MFS transporter [Chloracidobacterium sp.]